MSQRQPVRRSILKDLVTEAALRVRIDGRSLGELVIALANRATQLLAENRELREDLHRTRIERDNGIVEAVSSREAWKELALKQREAINTISAGSLVGETYGQQLRRIERITKDALFLTPRSSKVYDPKKVTISINGVPLSDVSGLEIKKKQ